MEKVNLKFDCGFDFDSMTTSERGAVCKTCSTEVVDFTKMSLAEIKEAFKSGEVKCGRFSKDQIGSIKDSRENILIKKKLAAAVLFLTLGIYQPSVAQSDSVYTFKVEKKPIENVDSTKSHSVLKELEPEKPFYTYKRVRYYKTSSFPYFRREKRRFTITGCPSF